MTPLQRALLDWWAEFLPSPRDHDSPLIFTDAVALPFRVGAPDDQGEPGDDVRRRLVHMMRTRHSARNGWRCFPRRSS